MNNDIIARLRAVPEAGKRDFLASLTADELAALEYAWEAVWARPDQLTPAHAVAHVAHAAWPRERQDTRRR